MASNSSQSVSERKRILLCREDEVSAGVRSREGSEKSEGSPFFFLVSLKGLDAFESRGFAV